ncbi:MAG TPA: pirin family protein [Polyangiaceae bacterium]|nr:pirin family protein [Polyangiaceae bacterium]
MHKPRRVETEFSRRTALALPIAGLSLGLPSCRTSEPGSREVVPRRTQATPAPAPVSEPAGPLASLTQVLDVFPLGAPPWRTFDPFLFCVHHDDAYPAGNAALGPRASLDGRNLGSDFEGRDGWRMYHGDLVPGFPRHPHRGFETVTVTRKGFIDHSDSLGATARYGGGDVQWMTAGKGIVHAEMFPLLDAKRPNPTELLQIWINLPRTKKFADPYFSMFWNPSIPDLVLADARGQKTRLRIVAGAFDTARAPVPPPDSWAARADTDVAIWTLQMAQGATITLPRAASGANRTLYFYRGRSLEIDGHEVLVNTGVRLRAETPVTLVNGAQPSELLLLQGQPIAEAVVQRGPFVMNTADEIKQAWVDYRETEFGGWPWPGNEPVHAADKGRFAIHADGRVDRAPG